MVRRGMNRPHLGETNTIWIMYTLYGMHGVEFLPVTFFWVGIFVSRVRVTIEEADTVYGTETGYLRDATGPDVSLWCV